LEHSEWNQPMQWKRINEMRIATWNVRTLHRAGAINELVKEMDKYIYIYIYIYIHTHTHAHTRAHTHTHTHTHIYIYIHVHALQEIRWPGKETVIKKNYVIVYSGHKSAKHEFGTGLYN